MTTEELVQEFGEQYRQLIESAIRFLDEKEPQWDLDHPADRREYIQDLIDHLAKEPDDA